MITVQDIPMHRGGADGIETLVSEKPLVLAWRERNHAVERTVWEIPQEIFAHYGYEPLTFDEILDRDDAIERSKIPQQVWFVARNSPFFQQADKELGLLFQFYQGACGESTQSLTQYQRCKQRLLDAGYTQELLDAVPSPPAPLHLLHLTNGCKGEIHKGLFKGQQGIIHNFRRGADYPSLFCTVCGWMSRNEIPSPSGVKPEPKTAIENLLKDLGPELFVPHPDIGCDTYMPNVDLEPGDDDTGIREAEEAAKQVTRRCMKVYGLLVSVPSRQARHGQSWPDPDEPGNRLVLAALQ